MFVFGTVITNQLYRFIRHTLSAGGLGYSTGKFRLEHIPLPTNEIPDQIIPAEHHTFVLCESNKLSECGNLYGFGSNKKGQLGLDDRRNHDTPVCLTMLKDIKILGVEEKPPAQTQSARTCLIQ